MTAKKTGRKTRDRTPKGLAKGTPIPMPNGGTLIAGAGRGPAKGAPNAGRPPNEWKQALRALADREAVLAHVDAALLAGPRRPLVDEAGHPVDRDGVRLAAGKEPIYIGSTFYQDALTYVTEHGYGRATQSVEHSGSVTLEGLLAQVNGPAE